MARIAFVFALLVCLFPYVGYAAQLRTRAVTDWVRQMESQAIEQGISADVVREALYGFVPNQRVIELDQRQPEGTVSFASYRRNVVNAARIKKGADLMLRYAAELGEVEKKTGVPPQVVVALWGIESSFGQNTGGFETINALATLAYEGRRSEFFQKELMAALRVIERNRIALEEFRGSWAGAMGQCQFMPSTYLRYAVDGDGDGAADIWFNPVDVIASIANYLAAEGWRGELTWGREVDASSVPDGSVGVIKPLQEWTDIGVVNVDGTDLPRRDLSAKLVRLDGEGGGDFLVYENFNAIMRWNRSRYFALSVGLLADSIRAYANGE